MKNTLIADIAKKSGIGELTIKEYLPQLTKFAELLQANSGNAVDERAAHTTNTRSDYPAKCPVSDFHCTYPECVCGR